MRIRKIVMAFLLPSLLAMVGHGMDGVMARAVNPVLAVAQAGSNGSVVFAEASSIKWASLLGAMGLVWLGFWLYKNKEELFGGKK